jgi:hypothetical protein
VDSRNADSRNVDSAAPDTVGEPLTLSGRRPAETIQTPAYLPARHILGKA